MEIIDELENTKRKVYAGGIGYFSANGDFDTCIALRTAISKNNKFYVQSGAGIGTILLTLLPVISSLLFKK